MSGLTIQSELVISLKHSFADMIAVQQQRQELGEGNFGSNIRLYEGYIRQLQDVLDE